MQNAALTPQHDARQYPRLKVPAMYSVVRVRLADEQRYRWHGHIYDVSRSGMRFEIDELIEPGTAIAVRGMLPGLEHVHFRASGHVVRIHDDADEPGPVRMAMHFDHFESETDELRLVHYLEDHGLKRAA